MPIIRITRDATFLYIIKNDAQSVYCRLFDAALHD